MTLYDIPKKLTDCVYWLKERLIPSASAPDQGRQLGGGHKVMGRAGDPHLALPALGPLDPLVLPIQNFDNFMVDSRRQRKFSRGY